MYESYPRSSKKLHLPPREHPEDLDHNLVLLAVEIIRDVNLALSKAPPKDHQLQRKVVKNSFGFHKPWLGGNTVRVWKLRNLGLYTLSSPKNDCLSSPMDLYTWIGGDLFHSKLGPLQLAGQPAVFTDDAESAPV